MCRLGQILQRFNQKLKRSEKVSRFRPHPSLKQELSSDQQKLRSFVIIGVLTVLVGVVAGVLYWLFFAAKNYSSASLTPIDSQFYMRLEWRDSSEQSANLNNLSLSLGGSTTIDDFLKILIPAQFGNTKTTFKNDIAPWAANDVAIVRRNISNKDEEVKIFVVSDKDKAQQFLDKIVRESDTTAKEGYKGYQIQSLFGTAPVAFTQVGNAVAFAGKPQVLHDVIDVAAGDSKPIVKAEDFKVAQKHLGENYLVSMFMDVSTFFRDPTRFGLPADFALNLGGQARMGLTVSAQESGFGLQVFIPKDYGDKKPENNFNEDILAITPNTIAGYIGATNLSALMNQYLTSIFAVSKLQNKNITQQSIESKYDVNIEQDLLSWMKGQYAIVSIAEKSNDFALIIKVDNKEQAATSLKKAEKAITGIVKELSAEPEKIPSDFKESDNGVRYLSVGGASNYNINYAFKDNFLVLATSRAALDVVLKPKADQPNLLNSKQYTLVKKGLPEGNASGTLYVQGSLVIGFLKSLGYNFTEFDRHIVGFGLKVVNIDDGRMVTGYLPIL